MDRKAFRKLSYKLYIVTSFKGDKLNGQIANVAFQVTSKPPKIAVCLNKENLTHEFVEESGCFGISVLSVDAPFPLIGLFGFRSGRDANKFKDVQYKIGKLGVPLVTEHSVAILEAKVTEKLDVGTHTLLVGEVVDAEVLSDAEPMTYDYYHKVKGGKSPEKALTFIKE
ncbi:flavin reductase domain protein [Thermosulfidibacter takaii ABI70S6]|uniref:Flavin reductase domain protein n=1 Tax=Thermosulfidibacter takaii (strain DSM 17441 / JCM 13301 / NBRC 103674 / ABI70S6) TaxID=1298851 RepID=A0A0S3QS30_THET7|nr:flavin reductase family protein [Thermosulfidibacter takaii]BAT71126.1 flavin reductase domain protein [Thermosulfidibacter takaii ABI70S6]